MNQSGIKRTEWIELNRLSSSDSTWYKRRVYGPCIKCSTCGKSKSVTKAFYEYSVLDDYLRGKIAYAEHGWDAGEIIRGTYCNRMCMPEEMLRRYNRANKKHRMPEYGTKREAKRVKSLDRLNRLVSRYEALGCIRGSVTALSIEEGISRQRVHQLLEKWYGRGQVPCLNQAAANAKPA